MDSRRAVVLGGGAIADVMAQDLARERDLVVTVIGDEHAVWTDAERLHAAVQVSHVVLLAVPREHGLTVLRGVLEARRLCADATTDVEQASTLDGFARQRRLAACLVGGAPGIAAAIRAARGGVPATVTWRNGPLAPDGTELDERIAALTTAALARRLLTGDFRDHWGVWTPAQLGARLGMVHGLLEDLKLRGISASIEPR